MNLIKRFFFHGFDKKVHGIETFIFKLLFIHVGLFS